MRWGSVYGVVLLERYYIISGIYLPINEQIFTHDLVSTRTARKKAILLTH